MTNVPQRIHRLIVHQIDLARSSPGGIDTCLRGIAKYAPASSELAFVGVDTGDGPSDRKLGMWEKHQFGNSSVWFLPVVKIDPGDQRRLVPHSLRLGLGLVRFLRQIPDVHIVQAHRMDLGLLISKILRKPLVYMVHTQRGGLTGKTSDSVWRFASKLHEKLEKTVIKRAVDVIVFNEEYSKVVKSWNPLARFSPTWWDPELIVNSTERFPNRLCWVGRLEVPKDPQLAIDVMEELARHDPDGGWSLSVLGSGTLMDDLKNRLKDMPAIFQESVQLLGRVEPSEVAQIMGRSQAFLMTSHAGYEGYPRVLVEALASGLPAIVTKGSDTGGIVVDARNGYVTDRDPVEIAKAIIRATELNPAEPIESVTHLSAPSVVHNVMQRVAVSL